MNCRKCETEYDVLHPPENCAAQRIKELESVLSAAKLDAEEWQSEYKQTLKSAMEMKIQLLSAEEERDRIKQAADHMADALKMARMAFEKNWAIDWNILDRAINYYESALAKKEGK